MVPVLMQHPIHGNKHAYMDAEIAADVRNGWRVATDHDAAVIAQASETPATPTKRKPGRPRKNP